MRRSRQSKPDRLWFASPNFERLAAFTVLGALLLSLAIAKGTTPKIKRDHSVDGGWKEPSTPILLRFGKSMATRSSDLGYGQTFEAGGPQLTASVTTLLAKNSAQKQDYRRCQQKRNHRQNQMGLPGFRGRVLKPFRQGASYHNCIREFNEVANLEQALPALYRAADAVSLGQSYLAAYRYRRASCRHPQAS